MYKKTEKKITYLLDKVILNTKYEISTFKKIEVSAIGREIISLLKEKNDTLNNDMLQKIIQIIMVKELGEARYNFLDIIASKDYTYISQSLADLLNFDELLFSAYIINTLYKMETVSYYNEIFPFSVFEDASFLHKKTIQYLKRAKSRLDIK